MIGLLRAAFGLHSVAFWIDTKRCLHLFAIELRGQIFFLAKTDCP